MGYLIRLLDKIIKAAKSEFSIPAGIGITKVEVRARSAVRRQIFSNYVSARSIRVSRLSMMTLKLVVKKNL